MNTKFALTLAIAAFAIAGCGAAATTTPTLPPLETGTAIPAAPATATATAAAVPSTAQPTVALPTAAPTVLPTITAGPLPSGDLSDSQMATILGTSLADYPWQMDFNSSDGATGQTITGTLAADSTSRFEVTIEEPVSGLPVTVDLIVITPTVYAEVTGVPTDVLQAAGLQVGQWAKVSSSQDVLGLGNLARAATDPSGLLLGLGFQDLLNPSPSDQTPFKLSGTEPVDGVETNVYERQVTGGLGTTNYRVNVGTADSRVYQMEAEGPVSATVTMTYDARINIQPPIP